MRILLRVVLVALVLMILVVGGGLYWLLHSNSGAYFTVHQLVRLIDLQVDEINIEGNLADGISLENLRVHTEDLSLSLALLKLKIDIEKIYPASLNISEFTVQGLTLQLPEAVAAPEPEPADGPLLPDIKLSQLDPLFDRLTIRLPEFRIQDVLVQQGEEEAARLSRLQVSITFENRLLLLDDLLVDLPDLSLQGGLSLNLADPELVFHGQARALDDADFWRTVRLDGRAATVAAGLEGALRAELSLSNMELLQLDLSWSLQKQELAFELSELVQQGRDGALAATGTISGARNSPRIAAKMRLSELDLTAEAGMPLVLSGTTQFDFDGQQYQGTLDLTSRGSDLVSLVVDADFHGDLQQVALESLTASWLDAQFAGDITAQWNPVLRVTSALEIRGFAPEALVPDIEGLINGRLAASYEIIDGAVLAEADVTLFNSLLQGYPLQGRAQLRYADDDLHIDALDVASDGLQLSAHGQLTQRINYQLQVDDLAAVHAASRGHLLATGWVQHRPESLTGELAVEGTSLGYDNWLLERLSGEVALGEDLSVVMELSVENLRQGTEPMLVDALSLTGSGTLAEHGVQLEVATSYGTLATTVHGQWADAEWSGEVTELTADTAGFERWHLEYPFALRASADAVSVAPLKLISETGQSVLGEGEYDFTSGFYQAELSWDRLSLSLLDLLLEDSPLSGSSRGRVAAIHRQDQQNLVADISVTADLSHELVSLQDMEGSVQLNWDLTGLEASAELRLDQDASVAARVSAPAGEVLAAPQAVDFSLACQAIPLPLVGAWLPPDFMVEGQIHCRGDGTWQQDQPASFAGEVTLEGGQALWYDVEQGMEVEITTARVAVDWHDQLHVDLRLVHDFGHIIGQLELPVAATWPLGVASTTPFAAQVDLVLDDNGLLSSFFPQQIQYSRGELNVALVAEGTLEAPQLTGSLRLENAEVYLPAAGIRAGDMRLLAELSDDQVRVNELSVTSGVGSLSGQGHLALRDWSIDGYDFSIAGDRFQLIDLPELKVRISPQLEIVGDLQQIKVRGDVRVPYVMVKDQKRRGTISNSSDLVIVDRQDPSLPARKFRHDIDIRLLLGEQVLLDIAGLEARVGGTLRLYTDANQDLAAQGVLQVARGRFSSYGVTLDIERGDLYYTGGPLTQPTLDVLALRRVGQVRAGVRATGTPQEPVVTLYSEPSMPDADVLAYVVLGRPLSAEGGDTDLLMTAAGALLSQGESIVLQETLKSNLGLDVLEFSAGGGDLTGSVVTTGKYLTPDLYVSLGYSLFTNTNEVRVRYRLTQRIDVESIFGLESGVDIFYRFEID